MRRMRWNTLWIIIILFIGTNSTSFAQNLTEEQKLSLQKRVKDKVDEYQFYLQQLADKQSTSLSVKNNAYRLALKLFIGEGAPYTVNEEDNYGNIRKVEKLPVRMAISSLHRPTKYRYQKVYLNSLLNNRSYTNIIIRDADVVRVDNIQKVGDHYECMAYFFQEFLGYLDKKVVYKDRTTKKVRVYIQAIQIPRHDGTYATIWNALLGDIYVVETKRLN